MELIRIYLIGSKVFIFENLKKVVNHSILQYNKLRPEAGAQWNQAGTIAGEGEELQNIAVLSF